jgi:hypothetical protein
VAKTRMKMFLWATRHIPQATTYAVRTTCVVRAGIATKMLRSYSNLDLLSSFGPGVHSVFETVYQGVP